MRTRIYTDGACSGNPGPGGWAMVVNTKHACEQYAGGDASTTNNRMELTGMVEALKYIAVDAGDAIAYEVYCDSAYVVNAINNGWLERWKLSGWKTKQGSDIKNRDLWELVDEYFKQCRAQSREVLVAKIKGHAGSTFNELADKLARAASSRAKAGVDQC